MLVDMQMNNHGPLSMLTVISDNPRGFGRVVRTPDGTSVKAVIEEAQASPEILAIRELMLEPTVLKRIGCGRLWLEFRFHRKANTI